MKCDDCEANATVHTAVIVGAAKQEIHLCQSCAERRKLLVSKEGMQLPAVVQPFVGSAGLIAVDLSKLKCPVCGTTYVEFRKTGRLGCPYDYVAFREGLRPLLDRVHRATHHTGKRPKALQSYLEDGGEIRELRCQLRQAIEAEDYAEAVRLRDRIREKEIGHGSSERPR
jgi:protein arginine kinase activator